MKSQLFTMKSQLFIVAAAVLFAIAALGFTANDRLSSSHCPPFCNAIWPGKADLLP